MKHALIVLGLGAVVAAVPTPAGATPSTQIWIPSTDVQAFLVPHLNSDVYVRVQDEPGNGGRKPPLYLFGPTMGILPWQKLQMEVGFDLIWQGISAVDKYPIYFHGKLGTPEDALFKWQPAIVAGIYNVGVKSDVTNQNIVYGLVGRTFPVLGRLSVGYFYAHDTLFPDENGKASNQGLLASWDRTIKELTPKLWLGVDYQGSNSWIGALSFGIGWAFTDNISMIFGYDWYTNRSVVHAATGDYLVPGRDTFTVQLDINLDRLVKTKVPEPKPAPCPCPTPASGPAPL
ncbi:MAG TPA: hypothetical protein VGQ83_17875 [Polyangia bacterium]|jgi:hypothetical protein